MIPSLIMFGLIFGRWWSLSLALAAIGWPSVLVVTGVMAPSWDLLGAAGLAIVNTTVGVIVHQSALWIIRSLRDPHSDDSASTDLAQSDR